MIGRLVEQQDVRCRSQRTGQRRAASLAAGQRGGVFGARKAEFLEQIQRPVMTVRRRDVKPGIDISESGAEPGQISFLGQVLDRRPRLSEAFSGIGLYQSGGYAQQGRLPEPLRPTRQIRSPAATARPAPDRSGAAPKVRLMSCSESNGVGTLQPLALCLAPHGREPGLPLSRQAGRAVVMVQFDETGRSHVVAPGVEVEEARVTTIAPALFVVTPRI